MEYLIEKNKDKGQNVTIKIPKIVFHKSILIELIKINKTTNINGFRTGKIPLDVLKKKYGNSVYYDVFQKLMQKFFYKFINKEKIKIIGYPQYYIHDNKDQKKTYLKYSVTYEIYPKFSIKNLELIENKKIIVKITDKDVKRNIEKYANNTVIWRTVNSSIKMHDRVTIDYDIYEKKNKIEKFHTENISFNVSDNTFLPLLNNKIINHFVNDIIFFQIKFYELHPQKELQNKTIDFKIKIKKIERQENIEKELKDVKYTEDYQLNEIYYQKIKKNLNDKINSVTQKYLQSQIIKSIIKKNPVFIPPLLLQEEIKNLYYNNIEQYKQKKHNLLEQKYYINLTSEADNILKYKIIIEKIINDNKILINESKIQSLIQNISLNYKQPSEIIKLYNKNTNFKNAINNAVLEIEVMDFLIKNTKIIEELWTFDQFMNHNWDS